MLASRSPPLLLSAPGRKERQGKASSDVHTAVALEI